MEATLDRWVETEAGAGESIVRPLGTWSVAGAMEIDRSLSSLELPPGVVALDLSRLERLDTAGAMQLWHLYDHLTEAGHEVQFRHVGPWTADLLTAVGDVRGQAMPRPRRLNPFFARILTLGKATMSLGEDVYAFLSFLGLVTLTLVRDFVNIRRLRFTAMCHHIEETGLKAMPIVGLLSFLIGVVIAYQGADQLRQFGADLFVVNLLGISILREIGVLMTAIIVAGRSGSAFTAQIGTMKVNQEVDALDTMGLEPAELLVVPRVLALVITLPFLTLYANAMALMGGAMMSYASLGITLGQFLHQLQDAVTLWTLWVGLIKAPVFAFVIAVVGCYQGLRVEGSAESVGNLTTRSVVHGIFLVILLDAFFSVLFAWLGI